MSVDVFKCADITTNGKSRPRDFKNIVANHVPNISDPIAQSHDLDFFSSCRWAKICLTPVRSCEQLDGLER